MFEKFAHALLTWGDCKPGIYTTPEINAMVSSIPLGSLEGDGVVQSLGESISVDKHVRKVFFEAIETGNLALMRSPVLLGRQFLENLEGWREWITLSDYLRRFSLEPKFVFLNDPVEVDGRSYYLGEVRVFCRGETRYEHRP